MKEALRINGKAVSDLVREEVKSGVARLHEMRGIRPGLLAIRVGDDPASEVYVRNKRRACEKAGISSWEQHLKIDTGESELISIIDQANKDPAVHGILVQLPLPGQINTGRVLNRISPDKDVDCFNPVNIGKLVTGFKAFRPCTPAGIMRILKEIGTDPAGKNAVVVGRSDIVGKPIALLLMHAHATVTICHSRTVDLEEVCRKADILVAAVGKPEFVRGSWIKPGAVVIDVGINRREDGSLTGDVAYEEATQNASAITPVPGGVGPMTIAMLLSNTLEAALNNSVNSK